MNHNGKCSLKKQSRTLYHLNQKEILKVRTYCNKHYGIWYITFIPFEQETSLKQQQIFIVEKCDFIREE